jgi:tryptophanyl-tRNA synthetase
MSSESQAQIVRITGKGQFRVSSEIINQVNTLDNEIVDLVKKISSSNDESLVDNKNEINKKIADMNEVVTSKGKKLDNAEIISSDIIIPNKDLALTDLKKIFKEEGLIPDS